MNKFKSYRLVAVSSIILSLTLVMTNGNLILQRYLSPKAVLATWKQACDRSV